MGAVETGIQARQRGANGGPRKETHLGVPRIHERLTQPQQHGMQVSDETLARHGRLVNPHRSALRIRNGDSGEVCEDEGTRRGRRTDEGVVKAEEGGLLATEEKAVSPVEGKWRDRRKREKRTCTPRTTPLKLDVAESILPRGVSVGEGKYAAAIEGAPSG